MPRHSTQHRIAALWGAVPTEKFVASQQDIVETARVWPGVTRSEHGPHGTVLIQFERPRGCWAPVVVVRMAPGSRRGWEGEVLSPMLSPLSGRKARRTAAALIRAANQFALLHGARQVPVRTREEKRAEKRAAYEARKASYVPGPFSFAAATPREFVPRVAVRGYHGQPRMERAPQARSKRARSKSVPSGIVGRASRARHQKALEWGILGRCFVAAFERLQVFALNARHVLS